MKSVVLLPGCSTIGMLGSKQTGWRMMGSIKIAISTSGKGGEIQSTRTARILRY